MKAIVANVLFGSIFGCLNCTNSAYANPQPNLKSVGNNLASPIFSANLLSQRQLPAIPQIISILDRVLSVDRANDRSLDLNLAKNVRINLHSDLSAELNLDETQSLSLEKLPYTHQDSQADLVLGFQNTFWSSQNKDKYWGLTTVERWGGGKHNQNPKPKKLPKLNYLNSAPILALGQAALTVSGGGNENLAKSDRVESPSQEFQEFRGGVTYHRGIADQVTAGVGFVYEDLLVGFTQLTYKSDVLPLQTTVSLMAKESGVDLHSHVRLEPSKNLVLNYYNDKQKHQFDANWGIIPGLNLTAKSNSKDRSFSTGVKVAIHSDFMSLSANAALDNNNNLQWKIESRIGRLKFAHNNNQQKSTSDLAFNFLDANTYGVQCSAFVKYQTRLMKQGEEEFTSWGTRINSAKTISKNKHQWTVDLGYGSGNYGQGLIINGSVALKPDMFLNLSYEAVSPNSDDTKVKVLLSSK